MSSVRWGDITLDDVQISTSGPRSFIVQSPARGNGGRVQDSGRDVRDVRVTVQWTSRGKNDDPEQRYLALLALDDGKTRMLSWSRGASMPAVMSIESDDDSRGHRNTVLRFVENRGDPRYVREPTAGVTVQTAVKAVQQRAKSAEAVLRKHGLPTDVVTHTSAVAVSWNEPTASTMAHIPTSARRQRSLIQAALADSAAVHDAYQSLLDLGAALSDAADTIVAQSAGTITLEIGEPITLLSLAASLGANQAERRMADILRLNNLRSINAVSGHRTLTVPSD